MNKQLIALAFGLTAALGSSLLHAEMHLEATTTVPFQFTAADSKMPAGEYRATLLGQGGQILLRHVASGASVILLAGVSLGGLRSESKVVFHQYGDRFFLSEVWFPQEQIGHAALPTKREREVKLALSAKPSNVTVAMR